MSARSVSEILERLGEMVSAERELLSDIRDINSARYAMSVGALDALEELRSYILGEID